MLVIDFLAVLAITGTVVGLAALVRAAIKDPEKEKGEENARRIKKIKRCVICSSVINPNVDILFKMNWYHVECYKETY